LLLHRLKFCADFAHPKRTIEGDGSLHPTFFWQMLTIFCHPQDGTVKGRKILVPLYWSLEGDSQLEIGKRFAMMRCMPVQTIRPLPDKFLGAMIAVMPLPGAPLYGGDDKRIVEQALSDLEHYAEAGVDAVILENSHDLPYIKPPLPAAAVELMKQIAREIRRRFPGPIGIQMLEAANETALEIAHEAGLDFVRAEGFVFAHVGGAGLIEGCAGKLLRQRKALNCELVRIFADVKKKHCSHALTSDLDIVDEAKQAEFFLVDGVIVTGARTTEPPGLSELRRVKKRAHVSVLIGSGMTAQNIRNYFPLADGFIVGSTFRKDGKFLAELEPKRLAAFVKVFRGLRRD
jgi:membrane complex biogenesis BtpA family protein